MDITKTIPVTISTAGIVSEMCGNPCQFLASIEDLDRPLGSPRLHFCNLYHTKLGNTAQRCRGCLQDFGTGVENVTDSKD